MRKLQGVTGLWNDWFVIVTDTANGWRITLCRPDGSVYVSTEERDAFKARETRFNYCRTGERVGGGCENATPFVL